MACVLASLAPSQIETSTTIDRDEAIFGDAPPEEPAVSTATGGGLLGQLLTVGATAFLRLRGRYGEVSRDPPNELTPFSSPNILDVFIDGRPHEAVRLFAQGRLRYDPTVRGLEPGLLPLLLGPEARVQLDQLYTKLVVEQRLFITLGKQRIRWGSGRLFNPTDFLNRTVINGLDTFDERLGVGLLKLHLPFDDPPINLYAFGLLEGAFSENRVGGAFRGEVAIEQVQIAASFAIRSHGPTQFGLDVSAGLGPIDVFTEVALENGLQRRFWRGTFAFDPLELPEPIDRRDDWFVSVSGGVDYSFSYSDRDVLHLGAEYFFNQTGYTNDDLYVWLLARDAFGASGQNPEFIPFRLGRHYLAAFLLLPSPGDLEDMSFQLVGIGNLSDRSFLTRFDWFTTIFSFVRINLFAQVHFGRIGEFRLEIDIPPTDFSPILQDGFYVPPSRFNAGVEVRVGI